MQTNDKNEYLRPSKVLKNMPEIKEEGFKLSRSAGTGGIGGRITVYSLQF
jgi:hypothetical protein